MFWKNFILLCNKKGIAPNTACAEMGYSTAIATKWKNGSVPRSTTLQKIADYFGVTPEYLLQDNETKKRGVKIPVLGDVAAGIPIEAIEDVIDYEEITPELARTGEFFALRISGDSMAPRILDGDVVIVKKQPDVDSGDLAIVIIDSENATCKKVQKNPDGIMLISNNPSYEPMFYSHKTIKELPITILGKVIELRGKF